MKTIKLYLIPILILITGCATIPKSGKPDLWQSPLSSLPSISGGETKRNSNVVRLESGAKQVMAEIQGPAVVHHLWITAMQNSQLSLRELVFRVYWDNEPEPSIEVPLGDFFGVGFAKEKEFKSLLLEMFPAGGETHGVKLLYPNAV